MSPVPTPVFIHGAGLAETSWRFQAPCFEGAQVLRLPGRPEGAALTSIEDLAAWVLDVVDDGPAVLVGHSMGGLVALEAALAAPERVAGVILIASGANIEVPARAFEETRNDFDARCGRFVTACYAHPDEAAIAHDAEAMRAVGVETVLADYSAVADWDGRPRLGDVNVPALVVCAGADRITPPALSEELARGLPSAISVLIPDVGHMVMCEAPDTVNLLIAGFLARVEVSLDHE